MVSYVAFLRGMNLGGRRITNDALCECFRDLGLRDVWAFLASGNVVFGSNSKSVAKVSKLIETGLRAALGYDVPTFLRTGQEVATIAAHSPFDTERGTDGGKLQISMLRDKPTAAARKQALAFATAADQLAIDGRELYWLPEGKLTESELDFSGIDRALGAMTMRTQGTLQRLAKKLGT